MIAAHLDAKANRNPNPEPKHVSSVHLEPQLSSEYIPARGGSITLVVGGEMTAAMQSSQSRSFPLENTAAWPVWILGHARVGDRTGADADRDVPGHLAPTIRMGSG